MEAALKEFEKIFDCCAQCRENKGEAREVELRKARLSNAELLADSVVVHRKGDVFELVYVEKSNRTKLFADNCVKRGSVSTFLVRLSYLKTLLMYYV